jgi:hypothetical protein
MQNGQNGILDQAKRGGIVGPRRGHGAECSRFDRPFCGKASRTQAEAGCFAGRPGPCGTAAMTKEEERELRATLMRLQQEHRDLDAAIGALQNTIGSDSLQVQRLKKRKLFLRDRITFIEDQLTPDIIA